jgi:N-acetylglutamate synthase-like GNAT family acetyltransferase
VLQSGLRRFQESHSRGRAASASFNVAQNRSFRMTGLIGVEIRIGREQDAELIRSIHLELKRPSRDHYLANAYLVAWLKGEAIGCAATSVFADGGYFYGLAVRRAWQRQGIGGQLMEARIGALRALRAEYAVALAMFWNSRFFRSYGFEPVKREKLPASALHHPDLRNPALRRSAVMLRWLRPTEEHH